MFMQIISGKVADRDTFFREGARWGEELRPTAVGDAGGGGGGAAPGPGRARAPNE